MDRTPNGAGMGPYEGRIKFCGFAFIEPGIYPSLPGLRMRSGVLTVNFVFRIVAPETAGNGKRETEKGFL